MLLAGFAELLVQCIWK